MVTLWAGFGRAGSCGGNLEAADASNFNREQGYRVEAPAKTARFEDALLVRQVQAGEAHAFTQLVAKYQDRVFNTCWRICGHAEDARDLTQDTFLKAFESIDTFRGRSAFYTWVFRIAVNLSLSHRRKGVHRAALSIDRPVRAGDERTAPAASLVDRNASDPSRAVTHAETAEQVTAALASIEPDHRVVIVLRDVEGFDYQEIADILDLAVGTVKSRLFRGRLALRERLRGACGKECSDE